MQDIKSFTAAGVDELSGRFLKDGADILTKSVSAFCNLSVYILKPILKKGKKTDP